MGRVRTAVVVGGGIAGPVTAAALQRAGVEAVVYEAHESGADDVGAFLQMAVNGIDALRAVDLDAGVVARGFATPRMVIVDHRGRVLADVPNGGALADGTSAVTITRPDLYAALRDAVVRRGIRVEHGRRLVATEPAGDRVRAVFADGTSAEADLLVGADGIRSTVRRLLDPGAPDPSYVGFLNTGGYARGVDVPGEPGVSHMVFGTRAFFGYTVAPDSAVWWFANPPAPAEPDPTALAAIPAARWRAQLEDLFAADTAPALEVIARTEEIFSGWVTYDLPSVPVWHDDRRVLVGDAAHAVSPSAGQGAALAAEDAVVLARCVRDIPDRAAALGRYEALRRRRVERVAAQGRRNGVGKVAGPVGRRVRDLVLPLAMRAMFGGGRDPLRWMWGHHLDWDAPSGEDDQDGPDMDAAAS